MCQLLAMNANTPTDIVFSFDGFRRRGGLTDSHSDGFGIAFFERGETGNMGLRQFHDNQPSHLSPVADLINQYPSDQKPAEDKEQIHAHPTKGQPREMKQQDQGNSHRPKQVYPLILPWGS